MSAWFVFWIIVAAAACWALVFTADYFLRRLWRDEYEERK